MTAWHKRLESAQQAVKALNEHTQGEPFSLTPMYPEDDQHTREVTCLLSIEMQLLALIEHVARSQLSKAGEKLHPVYADNPKRADERLMTEMLLQPFKDIFLSFLQIAERSYPLYLPAF
jgi:hypothetical protein